jgi:ubiquinone biosynthesis protein COQ4
MNSTATTPETDALNARVNRFLKVLHWTNTHLGRNQPPIVEMDTLRALPLGSLGRAWAQHLDDQGLQPFSQGPRRQQLHDGVHVLTGYGTDAVGEAEVQAFLLGAKFHPAHLLLLGGLLRGIRRQRRLKQISLTQAAVRSRLMTAYHRGQKSFFDPDHWQPEALWQQPLAEVQARFGSQKPEFNQRL